MEVVAHISIQRFLEPYQSGNVLGSKLFQTHMYSSVQMRGSSLRLGMRSLQSWLLRWLDL